MIALHAGDVERVRTLLEDHADVRAAVNEPISYFNSRPVARATKNLPLLDLLLAYGADLNLKSTWWAGGFGLMEYDCTPEEAAPLIERGAVVDVFAAANLGMFDRLRELVDRDPALVHARGGDGKTPLHCAHTVEIAQYLIDRGADINARDVDHESTPAQYLVREAPEVTRLLIERGAWFDIFMAVGLRDAALVERCLRDDPEALDHRIWHGKYKVAHNGKRAATREEIGDRRGDVYRWVFDHNASALDVAKRLGYDDIVELLMRHASPTQRLLAACAGADRAVAEAIVASHPDVVASLTRDQMRLIVDRAHANDTAAVALMLRSRVRSARTGRGRLGGDSLGGVSRQRGNAGTASAVTIHRSAFRIRPTVARRWASACTARCMGGSARPAISRRQSGCSSMRANARTRQLCRPAVTTWTRCCERTWSVYIVPSHALMVMSPAPNRT